MAVDAAEANDVEATLASYDVIGQVQDSDLTAIAQLAAQICGVAKATVNLLDSLEQHQVATVGFEGSSEPRSQSMCGTTVQLAEPVHLADASKDERFADSPWVNGELGDVRFYAGTQLRTSQGLTVGTLCVFDEEVRELDPRQAEALEALAKQVMQVLELRARTARLTSSIDELARSNADLSAFAGRVAHDLRNPIAATSGFLALAQGAFADQLAGRARECVAHATAAVERMAAQVDDLLAYAEVGAQVRCVEVDLARVAADVVADLQVAIDTRDGRVDVQPLPVVTSDPTLVRIVLLNLVANAVKYARPGVPPQVQVSGTGAGEQWSVRVSDNGRGIPAADRARVLEPFTRLRNTADVSGSGIGLATCARAATALGGRIEIGDAPGGGTCISLTVPA